MMKECPHEPGRDAFPAPVGANRYLVDEPEGRVPDEVLLPIEKCNDSVIRFGTIDALIADVGRKEFSVDNFS